MGGAPEATTNLIFLKAGNTYRWLVDQELEQLADTTGKAQMTTPLLLSSVYHKYTDMWCEDKFAGPYAAEHRGCGAGSGGDPSSKVVYDLVTSTDPARCSGTACQSAALAIDRYQQLLAHITTLLTDLIHQNWPHLWP